MPARMTSRPPRPAAQAHHGVPESSSVVASSPAASSVVPESSGSDGAVSPSVGLVEALSSGEVELLVLGSCVEEGVVGSDVLEAGGGVVPEVDDELLGASLEVPDVAEVVGSPAPWSPSGGA